MLRTLATSALALSLILQLAPPASAQQTGDFWRCQNDNPWDGYWWNDDPSICVPGMVSVRTWYTPAPPYAKGASVWYAPNVMEATAHYRQLSLEGYVDGVSLMSPSDIGRTVWLRRPGYDWEGPFLVVDCAQRDDIYPVIMERGEIVEVGFQTAARWGMIDATLYETGYDRPYKTANWKLYDVEVLKMDEIPPWIDNHEPLDYVEWWGERVVFSDGNDPLMPVGLNPKYFPDKHPGWLWKASGDPIPMDAYDDWFFILFGDHPAYKFDLPNNYHVTLSGKWLCIVYSYCRPGIQPY